MGFFSSLSKSFKLRSVSKRLGKSLLNGDFSIESMFAAGDAKDAALDDLLHLCESDRPVRHVIQQRGATREDLKELYHLLEAAGAGQWVGAHYVSASELAFGQTLDFALRKLTKPTGPKGDPREIAYRLIRYFEDGEVGMIPD